MLTLLRVQDLSTRQIIPNYEHALSTKVVWRIFLIFRQKIRFFNTLNCLIVLTSKKNVGMRASGQKILKTIVTHDDDDGRGETHIHVRLAGNSN